MMTLGSATSRESHDDEQPMESIDQRADPRIRTIFRMARVATLTDEGLCRVHNISNHGLKLTTGFSLTLGDAVWVTFSDEVTLSGSVIWVREKECGLQLEGSIDCAALLQKLAQDQQSGRARALRLPIDTLGLVYSELGVETVRVLDISQYGMKIAHRQKSFQEGLSVKVRLRAGLERRGVIRWTGAGVAGIRLLEGIAQVDLESRQQLAGGQVGEEGRGSSTGSVA